MKKVIGVVALLVVAWIAINTSIPAPPKSKVCSVEWFSYVGQHYFDISDGHGHGPDPGSSEWLGSVEWKAKLPIRGNLPDVERCERIQQQLESHTFIINNALGLDISL